MNENNFEGLLLLRIFRKTVARWHGRKSGIATRDFLQPIAVAIDKEDRVADCKSPRSDQGRAFCRGPASRAHGSAVARDMCWRRRSAEQKTWLGSKPEPGRSTVLACWAKAAAASCRIHLGSHPDPHLCCCTRVLQSNPRRNQLQQSIAKGFTLIEVMIVVAIIAILAAIAIPSYREYIMRGQIVDGLVPLADMGGKMEQYFQDNRTYVGACSAGTVAPAPNNTPRFSYSCGSPTKSAYTVTAEGAGSMAGFKFTLNQQGQRATTSTPSGWTAGSNCWSARKDGSC